jgi:deazaflavin-dependent oxidoreductase (nitroreductase family)
MELRMESQPRVPKFVGLFNPLARRMLGVGMPMGPNALITITGRKSGLSRTTPVSVIEIGGRRWVIGTFGETNWVRNLRAAGEATITAGKRQECVKAIELSRPEGVAFFRDVLGPYVRGVPLGKSILGLLGAGDILDDPVGSAERRPVFEVRAA